MDKKFAPGMNFYKLVWVFAIFSVFGTIYEEALILGRHLLMDGQWLWEPRSGVFWGPFSPIYGLGAILMLYPLVKWRTFKPWQTFLLTAPIGGVFEYLASVFQELVMHTRSWDYSDHFLNFDGRTSLWVMTIWGVLGVLLVHVLWPRLSHWLEQWPPRLGRRLTILLAVFLVFDCTITATALIRQDARQKGVPPTTIVGRLCDQHFSDNYIARKIPNLQPTN